MLDEIARQIDLSAALGEYGDYLLSLAYAHCVSPDSLTGMVDWYQKTEIGSLLSLSDVTYKKLIEAIDSVDGLRGSEVQGRIFGRLKEVLDLSPRGYFYDITNIYFYGVCCPLAKRGHNADGRKDRQIQVGLAVTQGEGIPIFHKVFEGNIFDGRTLPDILLQLRRQDIKDVYIVWVEGFLLD